MRYCIYDLPSNTFDTLTFPLAFSVQKSTDGGSTWATVESNIAFTDDWSYDDDYDSRTNKMSFPVNGIIDPRQAILYTIPNLTSYSIKFVLKNGSQQTSYIYGDIMTQTEIDGYTAFGRGLRAAGAGTEACMMTDFVAQPTDVDRIIIGGSTVLKVVPDCYQYVVYYKNIYGGWDTMLMSGYPGDALTRYTRKVLYDNRNASARGEQNYVNEVGRRVTMHTGPLDSAQALRMRHLLTSPEVYFSDLDNPRVYLPAIISGNDFDYRTVRQNGQRYSDYAVTLTVAQQFERR